MATPTPPASAQQLHVRAELIALFYARSRHATYTNPLIGLLSLAVLLDKAPVRWLVGWFLLLCAHSIARLALYARYYRAQPEPEAASRWAIYLAVATTSSGIVWGALGVMVLGLIPLDPVSIVFVVCVFAGYIAASVSAHSAYLPAAYSYLAVLLSMTALGFLLRADGAHYVLAGISVIYLAINIAYARNSHRTLFESIALRFENHALIEELKQKRAEAEAANVAKSKFLAAASHDLRQPLHALTLFASALDEHMLHPDGLKLVDNINASVGALGSLFTGLLDISRLDAGVVQPQLAAVRLRPLIERLRNDFETEAQCKRLKFSCEANDLVVHTDPQLLERILRNFLSNAFRYTEHGEVSLRCRAAGSVTCIEIADTGKGIPLQHQRDVFGEFYQLENSERDSTKGMGLGLAIVDRLAQLLGHTIGLQSEPGRGSVFHITVPMGDAAASASPRLNTLTSAADIAGLIVLVVDDEASVREGTQQLLAQWGCVTLLAASADDAIELLRSKKCVPDVVMSDYRLRESQTGAQAIEQVRAECGVIMPGLIITGDTAPDRLREASASGLQLLHKPVAPAQLRAFLRHVKQGRVAKAPAA
jgi:two-component system, sensor histidine kinase